MSNYRISLLFVCLTVLYGCDYIPKFDDVLPDTRDEYRKSRDLPPLEVPPDLTNKTSDAMAIPGEEEAVTLSEFQRQRAQATGSSVLGKGEFAGEQWLALRSSPTAIWPELLRFWEQQGFTLGLEDRELGVMETGWNVRDDSNGSLRERFRIFTESGEEGETMLYLSSEQQLVTEGEWFDTQPDAEREKEVIRALNLYFYGTVPEEERYADTAPRNTSRSDYDSYDAAPERDTRSIEADREPSYAPATSRSGFAQFVEGENDRNYLALPDEYSAAWVNTQEALEMAGIIIQDMNPDNGVYTITYYPSEPQKDGSLLDKLKFWDDEESAEDGVIYQISLTGVGDITEAVVNDAAGNHSSSDAANEILDILQRYYNQL